MLIVFSTILLNTSIESEASTSQNLSVTCRNQGQIPFVMSGDSAGTFTACYAIYDLIAGRTYSGTYNFQSNYYITATDSDNFATTLRGSVVDVSAYMPDGTRIGADFFKGAFYLDNSVSGTTVSGDFSTDIYLKIPSSYCSSNGVIIVYVTYGFEYFGSAPYKALSGSFGVPIEISENVKYESGDTTGISGKLDSINETEKEQLEQAEEQTETQKGIWQSIKDFFGSFFDNLISSIIHVIVPTSEEMSDLFNRLNDFFAETFGFLYYPFDFIIQAFNIFLEADSATGLTLPGFSIMGYEVWSEQTYDLASEPIVGTIFGYVRMGTGAMLAMAFLNYLRDFFDKRFGGGGN